MGRRFELAFAERYGVGHAIGLCNGTATLHCCLAAVGVGPGDEVIVPPLTAGATAFAVLHQGAIPVFADIDPRTFNIDPDSVSRRVTSLTRAIMPVGLYGLSADMDPLMSIAKEHDLAVVEDNAQCFLATYKGRLAGTTGHLASFSLQASKHITTGDGGVIITDNEDLATAARKFGCFGYHTLHAGTAGRMRKEDRGQPGSIRHDFLGWNYSMSELQAAVALEQTERIDELVERHITAGTFFLEAVGDCPWLRPQHTPDDCVNSYWTFACVFEADKAGLSWDDFRKRFYERGGDFAYGAWRLTYDEPVFQDRQFLGGGFPVDSAIYKGTYRDYGPGLCPVAEELQPKLFQFKTNYMDMDDARRQADALRKTIDSV
jgi:perosamine synthetase